MFSLSLLSISLGKTRQIRYLFSAALSRGFGLAKFSVLQEVCMYSVVLMMALSGSADVPAFGGRLGCHGCQGACYGGGACHGGRGWPGGGFFPRRGGGPGSDGGASRSRPAALPPGAATPPTGA